ncbi:tyrosine-type recombinase/integrase [Candidatus Bathyarchaeota archaeon]|nr:tyrosine-type recombinase/integrase [Candidatus Bathyarchaeota archaeon]
MDEKGFIRFLKARELAEVTRRAYVIAVKEFERWLCEHLNKSLEEANKSDLRACELLTSNPPYPYGVRAYYHYLGGPSSDENVETITSEIIPKLPKSPPRNLLRWTEFRNIMEQAEKNAIRARDRALLNVLWSRMKSKEILQLRRSDIDFEKKVITTRPPDRKTYRVTPEAWDALEKYIPIESRGERKHLFPKIRSARSVQQITQKYFGFRNIVPNRLRKSCKEDLYEEGKKRRFYQLDKKPSSRIEKTPKKKQKRRLFLRLVEEIENFGSRVHNRISKIKDEKEFQRILEGYLLAIFPEEIITHEFRFKGYEDDSIIDFAVGKAPKIPIEVKFAKGKIRGFLADGSEQVKEFLESRRIKKGILVIVSKDRGRAHELARKFNGLQPNGVHVIII